MKPIVAFLFFVISVIGGLRGQYVTIPDANFVTFLQTNFPTCMSGNQMDTTCPGIVSATNLNVSSLNIADLEGVRYFDNLDVLQCYGNLLTSLPELPSSLIALYAYLNQIDSLPNLPSSLETMSIGFNQLTSLPPLPTSLKNLQINNNLFTSLPALPPNLEILEAKVNQISGPLILPASLRSLHLDYNPIDSLPFVLPNLQALTVYSCNLSTLPALPSGLQFLDCGNNPITILPAIPSSVTVLVFSSVQISSFPLLPSGLQILECNYNNLHPLPTVLPATLVHLYCAGNQLDSLPVLPPNLQILDCGGNNLTYLPSLPSSLIDLKCFVNQLQYLPILPSGLNRILADQNLLTYVSDLPDSLHIASFSNNQISCFAPFPQNNFLHVEATNNPFTCLPNYPFDMNPAVGSVPICTVGNPMGCPAVNGIFGTVFDDRDADCMYDSIDLGIRRIPIHIYDSGGTFVQSGVSNLGGAYYFSQGPGTWIARVDTSNAPFVITCPSIGIDSTFVLSVGTEQITDVNFEVDCLPGFDIGTRGAVVTEGIFPGRTFGINVLAGDHSSVFNFHCASGVSGDVVISYTGAVNYVGPQVGSLTPTVTGNTFTYSIPDFGQVNFFRDFGLVFHTQSLANTTDTICFAVNVTPTIGDIHPINNAANICLPVRASFDPNFKTVNPQLVDPGSTEWLNYTIHFQNTGNAPAFNIRLEDTLDANLDWETLEMVDASHYETWNLIGNRLVVYFPNIQLPDSSSDPAGSQGWFAFRVRPKAGMQDGTQIDNETSIYFDFNSPIITNIASTYFGSLPIANDNPLWQGLSVSPNPSSGRFSIRYGNDFLETSWTVTNLMGQELLHGNADRGEFAVDLSAQPAGFYLLQLSDGRQSFVRQIIKQ